MYDVNSASVLASVVCSCPMKCNIFIDKTLSTGTYDCAQRVDSGIQGAKAGLEAAVGRRPVECVGSWLSASVT